MKPVTLCAAVAAQALLYVGAAQAEPPPCGDPEIIGGLKSDAKAMIVQRSGPTGNALLDKVQVILVPNGEFDIKINEMFTASRAEDARQCKATLHLVGPGRADGTISISYTTIRTEDGKNVYQVGGGQDWATGLFESLKVNNNLQPSLDEVGREILRSATIKPQVQQFMQANPNFNRPAPSARRPLEIPPGYHSRRLHVPSE